MNGFRGRFCNRWQQRRAQSLVEFALILPVIILLSFGLIDIGRLFQAYVTIQHAAREAGRYAVTGQRMDDPLTAGAKLTREESLRRVARSKIIALPVIDGGSSERAGFWQVDLSDKDGNGKAGQSGEMVGRECLARGNVVRSQLERNVERPKWGEDEGFWRGTDEFQKAGVFWATAIWEVIVNHTRHPVVRQRKQADDGRGMTQYHVPST